MYRKYIQRDKDKERIMSYVCRNCNEEILMFGTEETCATCKQKKEDVMNKKIDRLLAGETIVSKEPGNSMTPIIKHRQPVRLAPVKDWNELEIGDVAYCKVSGKIYTHLVTAKDSKRGLQISNNHGYVNGWTKTVYGKMIEVL
jgi:hypothetical protein